MNVFHDEPRCNRHRIVDQPRSVGNPGHPQPRRVQFEPRACVVVLEQGPCVVANVDAPAEGTGDAIGRDVVMGRPYPATGEDMVIGTGQRLDRLDDRLCAVAHDADLLQVDPGFG